MTYPHALPYRRLLLSLLSLSIIIPSPVSVPACARRRADSCFNVMPTLSPPLHRNKRRTEPNQTKPNLNQRKRKILGNRRSRQLTEMGDLTEAVTSAPSPNQRPLPIREDCWTEEATSTLVDAWGSRFVELSRGNLRQKDWQDVADAVNELHGHTKKTHRTDVQCKNRIDTIKKKYKAEKARVVSSDGAVASTWPFLERMESLIGSSFSGKKPPEASVYSSPPLALPIGRSPAPGGGVGIVALPQKRPMPRDDGGFLRKNYPAMAAAAAAAAAYSDSEEDGEGEDEDNEMEEEEEGIGLERGSGGGSGGGVERGEGMRQLAQAIERFGEVYEKVEREKLRQMVDLEKQRMKFAMDLEMERMRILTETKIQLEKIKKGSGGAGGKIQQQLQHHHRSTTGSNGDKEY